MLTVKLISTQPKQPSTPYAKLLQCINKPTLVILLNADGQGTVVSACDSPFYKIGEVSSGWVESSFKPFLGRVILEETV
jgi:hypothetical protein